MIETVLGQGEGLVSGEITPDRYVMDKNSSKLCYQKLHKQTHKFARSTDKDGVKKVRNIDRKEGPVLNEADLKVCKHN